MSTFLFVFVAMLIIAALMAVGVLLGKKPISGSCGGMSALGMDTACDICGGDKTKCEKESVKTQALTEQSEAMFHDATQVGSFDHSAK